MDNNYNNQPESSDSGTKERVDFPRRTHREEYAAEMSAPRAIHATGTRDESVNVQQAEAGESRTTSDAGRTVGYVGIGLGILSLFMWSIILGPLAAIMGFYAYSQGRRVSGGWAIGLGIISTLSFFLLMPYTR